MKHLRSAILIFLLTVKIISAQDTLSGVINSYAKVTQINNFEHYLTVENASDFSPCDYILLIQMKGADIRLDNDESFGKIISYNDAGTFEVLKILGITGNTFQLESPAVKDYSIARSVQVVSIPQYERAVVNAPLTCKPWDGETGGVLIFEATSELILDAPITVSGKGFRSFDATSANGDCSAYDYVYPASSDLAARKGEGIVVLSDNFASGRGPAGNGGGGGNLHNSGGGGGANGGAGGMGGYEWSICHNNDTENSNNGLGGYPIQLLPNKEKIFMGGAGGTGHGNNGVNSNGGFGGGIAIIITNKLQSNNQKILAEGQHAKAALNDAAGGGGAGGSILLQTEKITGKLSIDLSGGKGGNIDAIECHGTGGGGGGGFLWYNKNSLPYNVTVSLKGGDTGKDLNTQALCHNSSYGATKGKKGTIKTELDIGAHLKPPSSFDLFADPAPIVCLGDSLSLFSEPVPNNNYTWFGPNEYISSSSSPTLKDLNHNQTGWYILSQRINNCTSTKDSLLVSIMSTPTFDLGPDTTLCSGDELLLTAGTPELSYNWNNESTDHKLTITESGTYGVVAYNGCESYFDQIAVTFDENCHHECPLISPNALSANEDGLNDVFQQLSPCDVTTYQMSIFNRYGEKLWETRDIKQGWDGRIKNKAATKGVYIWVTQATLKDDFGEIHYLAEKGLLTLL